MDTYEAEIEHEYVDIFCEDLLLERYAYIWCMSIDDEQPDEAYLAQDDLIRGALPEVAKSFESVLEFESFQNFSATVSLKRCCTQYRFCRRSWACSNETTLQRMGQTAYLEPSSFIA